MIEQRYYEVVAEELNRRFLRHGLWARAVAETGGEGDAARALYIRLRVSELVQLEQVEQARVAAQQQQQAAEALAENQLREAEARRRTQEEEEEAERLRIDRERAASPYFGCLFVSGAIIASALVFYVACYILFG